MQSSFVRCISLTLGDKSKFSLEQLHNVEHFSLGDLPESSLKVSWMTNILLLPISLRSVRLYLECICAWDIPSLFHHFRDLGNLSLLYHTICPQRRAEDTIALESSLKFRGGLNCLTNNDLAFFTTLLGNLPNGVHFTRANASVPWEEPQFVNKLLRSLAHTLMSLNIETNSRGRFYGKLGSHCHSHTFSSSHRPEHTKVRHLYRPLTPPEAHHSRLSTQPRSHHSRRGCPSD